MSVRAAPALPALLVVLLASSGCAAPDLPEGPPAADLIPRTADPATRGYTEANFPRMQELAPGVYSYEALRSAGAERFTTVSLVVVTDEGVLVGDGQGSPEETARMVAAIREITDQPTLHVVHRARPWRPLPREQRFHEGASSWPTPPRAILEASAQRPTSGKDAPTGCASQRTWWRRRRVLEQLGDQEIPES